MVDFRAFALIVRAVSVGCAFDFRAFIKANIEVTKRVFHRVHRAVHFTLQIGVFNTQVHRALALVRDAFVCNSNEQVAQVNETRGAGCKTSYLRALG